MCYGLARGGNRGLDRAGHWLDGEEVLAVTPASAAACVSSWASTVCISLSKCLPSMSSAQGPQHWPGFAFRACCAAAQHHRMSLSASRWCPIAKWRACALLEGLEVLPHGRGCHVVTVRAGARSSPHASFSTNAAVPWSVSHHCARGDRDLGLMACFGSPVPRRACRCTCAPVPFLCANNLFGVFRDRHTSARLLGLCTCCDQGLGLQQPCPAPD